jgi:hypothetical protein
MSLTPITHHPTPVLGMTLVCIVGLLYRDMVSHER